jgi:hypothetical protein
MMTLYFDDDSCEVIQIPEVANERDGVGQRAFFRELQDRLSPFPMLPPDLSYPIDWITSLDGRYVTAPSGNTYEVPSARRSPMARRRTPSEVPPQNRNVTPVAQHTAGGDEILSATDAAMASDDQISHSDTAERGMIKYFSMHSLQGKTFYRLAEVEHADADIRVFANGIFLTPTHLEVRWCSDGGIIVDLMGHPQLPTINPGQLLVFVVDESRRVERVIGRDSENHEVRIIRSRDRPTTGLFANGRNVTTTEGE